MLDFRIDSFLSVCKYLSYTRAAKELGLTQPAITQHIQYLQECYKVKFFNRESNRLSLTPEGEIFRRTMITMRRDEEKLRRDLLNVSKEKFFIRFGATLTIGEFELSPRLAAYMKAHPDREICMMVQNTETLLRMLDEGSLDFVIIEGYFTKNEYSYIPWSTEKYICVCSSEHDLPDEPLKFKDILSKQLIIRTEGSGTREVLMRLFESRNLQLSDFEHIAEISDLQVIKQLVAEDCGITFLYRKAVEKELSDGTLKEIVIDGCDVFHEFNFLWRKGSIYEPLFRIMYDKLQGERD